MGDHHLGRDVVPAELLRQKNKGELTHKIYFYRQLSIPYLHVTLAGALSSSSSRLFRLAALAQIDAVAVEDGDVALLGYRGRGRRPVGIHGRRRRGCVKGSGRGDPAVLVDAVLQEALHHLLEPAPLLGVLQASEVVHLRMRENSILFHIFTANMRVTHQILPLARSAVLPRPLPRHVLLLHLHRGGGDDVGAQEERLGGEELVEEVLVQLDRLHNVVGGAVVGGGGGLGGRLRLGGVPVGVAFREWSENVKYFYFDNTEDSFLPDSIPAGRPSVERHPVVVDVDGLAGGDAVELLGRRLAPQGLARVHVGLYRR